MGFMGRHPLHLLPLQEFIPRLLEASQYIFESLPMSRTEVTEPLPVVYSVPIVSGLHTGRNDPLIGKTLECSSVALTSSIQEAPGEYRSLGAICRIV